MVFIDKEDGEDGFVISAFMTSKKEKILKRRIISQE